MSIWQNIKKLFTDDVELPVNSKPAYTNEYQFSSANNANMNFTIQYNTGAWANITHMYYPMMSGCISDSRISPWSAQYLPVEDSSVSVKPKYYQEKPICFYCGEPYDTESNIKGRCNRCGGSRTEPGG